METITSGTWHTGMGREEFTDSLQDTDVLLTCRGVPTIVFMKDDDESRYDEKISYWDFKRNFAHFRENMLPQGKTLALTIEDEGIVAIVRGHETILEVPAPWEEPEAEAPPEVEIVDFPQQVDFSRPFTMMYMGKVLGEFVPAEEQPTFEDEKAKEARRLIERAQRILNGEEEEEEAYAE